MDKVPVPLHKERNTRNSFCWPTSPHLTTNMAFPVASTIPHVGNPGWLGLLGWAITTHYYLSSNPGTWSEPHQGRILYWHHQLGTKRLRGPGGPNAGKKSSRDKPRHGRSNHTTPGIAKTLDRSGNWGLPGPPGASRACEGPPSTPSSEPTHDSQMGDRGRQSSLPTTEV